MALSTFQMRKAKNNDLVVIPQLLLVFDLRVDAERFQKLHYCFRRGKWGSGANIFAPRQLPVKKTREYHRLHITNYFVVFAPEPIHH